MFDDLHVEDDVKDLSFLAKILNGNATVVDRKSFLFRVPFRNHKIPLNDVDASDPRSQTRHCFAQDATSTPDIESTQPREGLSSLLWFAI